MTGAKRQQPSDPTDETSPKRQRTSPPPAAIEKSSRKPSTSTTSKPALGDETRDKRRNQRLFGALLGGLGGSKPATSRSAAPSSTVAKRRAEAEERRREEAKKREQELGARQQERIARLQVERKQKQRYVDERNLRLRHENRRSLAGFLQTETEPKLYYLPWKLRPEEEERLRVQKEDCEIDIDRELDDFADLKRSWQDADEKVEPENLGQDEADEEHMRTNGDAKEARSKERHVNENGEENGLSANPTTEETHTEVIKEGHVPQEDPKERETDTDTDHGQMEEQHGRERKGSIDDAGDVVVEGEEDTVIY